MADFVPALSSTDVMADKDALQPDPGTEAEFAVENNKFAFSPGQLAKLYNPKSLAAFRALGGLDGIEKGLRSNRTSGLSAEEQYLEGSVTFEDAVAPSTKQASSRISTWKPTAHIAEDDEADAYADRKRVFSDNRLPERKSKNIFQLAWAAYNDKVLLILSGAAMISLALGLYQTFGVAHEPGVPKVEWIEGVAIIAAIAIVVAVGAANDWQKERQFVRLNRKKEDRTIKVTRSGRKCEISVFDVVVGDMVNLEPGDVIPVDGILVQGHGVRCDESSATGESDLLKKMSGEDAVRAMENHGEKSKADPFILSGAKVSEGIGAFMVTATGVNSSYGRTMMSLRTDSEVTPLQTKLNILATYIAKLGSAAALILFAVLCIEFLVGLKGSNATPAEKGQHFLDILIVAITVVVVAVPEGLPLAVTLALAFATTRMLKDNNLVRLLRSCETMGNATTICSDKTGTLTQNKMTVVAGSLGTGLSFDAGTSRRSQALSVDDGRLVDGVVVDSHTQGSNHNSAREFASSISTDIRALLKQSIIQNTTAFECKTEGRDPFIGSKTETALLEFAREHFSIGSLSEERSNANIVQVIPFESKIKCSAAVVKLTNGHYRMYVKGASEILLGTCEKIATDVSRDSSAAPMTSDDREKLERIITIYASRSLRTISLIYRDFASWPPEDSRTIEDDSSQAVFQDVFKQMTFVAVVGIQDPLRENVHEAVEDCQRAGVCVRMVTGDNVLTAKAIAQDCGILVDGGVVMEGSAFRQLSEKDMDAIIPKLCVLARSSPEDKRKLVQRLKGLGDTVAVTGDGTNDAPALKAADVGFSMGIAGTEVAKEASAIILMDDNFASIVKALLWGRAVNDAVKKFLQFQITVNITAVVLTFVSAVSSDEQKSVLTAVQLLWVNLIMDTFAALALATDPPTRSLLDRKPDLKSAPLITLRMWKMIVGQAIYQLTVTLFLYFAGAGILQYDDADQKGQLPTLIFNTFVWMQIFNALNNRRLDNRFNVLEGITHNWFFIIIFLIMIGGQTTIIFVGGIAFSVKGITGTQWGISVGLGFLSLPVGMIVRLIPDKSIRKCIPSFFKRKRDREVVLVDEDYRWNEGLLEVRDELAFIKRLRGGRLSSLEHKVHQSMDIFSVSRSSHCVTGTCDNNTAQQHELSHVALARRGPCLPLPHPNSIFDPAAVLPGIVAGSVAGWTPIVTSTEGKDPHQCNRSMSEDESNT
jgi:Ca2+-transporting ATPase